MTAAKVSRLDINLNDAGFLRIKLPPRKIAAKQEQSVTGHQRMVTLPRSIDRGIDRRCPNVIVRRTTHETRGDVEVF
jgi:hypothetical protein